MLPISSGKKSRPQKVVIYGPEGIGKSTLASKFPNPLFLDVEGGTDHMDVLRLSDIRDWTKLKTYLIEIASEKPCDTVVLDTADWAEALCCDYVLKQNNKKSIEDFGYGKGYTILGEAFSVLLKLLQSCIDKGINVVVLAHAKMRKFEQPEETGAYDRWEMKLSKQCAPMLKEWADMVLFLNYQTMVVTTKDKKAKATGGKRVIFTSHHACWDAKNRHQLPDELPLEWAPPLSSIFEKEVIQAVPNAIEKVQKELGGTVEAIPEPGKKLTPLETVRELGRRNGIDDSIILEILKAAELTRVSTMEEVPNSVLEMVIDNWDDFKAQADEYIPF